MRTAIYRKSLCLVVATLLSAGPTQADESALEAAVSGSQDFEMHRNAFLDASERLVQSTRCTVEDFKAMRGWAKSEKGANIYFVYCGGFSKSNRVYTNVSNGEIYQ